MATLLHGHTHRPAIHPLTVDGRACTRIVLGDWHAQGSVLRWNRGGPELVSLPRQSSAMPAPSQGINFGVVSTPLKVREALGICARA